MTRAAPFDRQGRNPDGSHRSETWKRNALHVPFGDWWEEDGRVCCHLCGRWFVRLDPHLRGAHDVSTDRYRLIAGLRAQRPLCSTAFSARIAARLAAGAAATDGWQEGTRRRVERARSGDLPAQGSQAHSARPRDGERRRAEEASGRRVGTNRAATFRRRRTSAAEDLGYGDLPAYYRRRYLEDRMTLIQLAAELGCSESAVRGDLKRFELGPLRSRSAGARWKD